MASKRPVVTVHGDRAVSFFWEQITNADTIVGPVDTQFVDFADRSMQVTGTFDGCTIAAAGSNDGTNFATLKDGLGGNASVTAAGIKQIYESTLYLIPTIASAGASTDVDITVVVRRGPSGRGV